MSRLMSHHELFFCQKHFTPFRAELFGMQSPGKILIPVARSIGREPAFVDHDEFPAQDQHQLRLVMGVQFL